MLRYAELDNVDTPLLLGQRLKPLSLGHIVHLQSVDSIFLSPVKIDALRHLKHKELLTRLNELMGELLIGITICSLSYEDYLALMSNALWLDDERRFITLNEYMEKWSVAVKKITAVSEPNILQSVHIFNRYISEGYKMPDTEYIGKASQEPANVDWITTLFDTLVSQTNTTKTEVLNQPLRLTFIQYFKVGERNGVIHFVSPEEAALRELALKEVTTNG